MQWEYLVLAVGLLCFAGYLSFVARRLDRLHRRVEGATVALDTQLARRAQVATSIALGGMLDPAAAALLHDGAIRASEAASAHPSDPLTGFSAQRETAESALSQVLRATLDDLEDDAAFWGSGEADDLGVACHRIALARRLHNDAVTASLAVRNKRLVRWLRLAGRAAKPVTVEIDDEPPARVEASGVPGGS